MPIQESSAGVIVFRRPQKGAAWEFLLLDYGRYWDYAKGHVEKGEDDEAAAIRELAEETGIRDGQLMEGFRHEIAYYFRSKRGLVRKRVVFFLCEVQSDHVTISHEHVGYEWLKFDAAIQRLGYASAKEVLHAAQDFLEKRSAVGA